MMKFQMVQFLSIPFFFFFNVNIKTKIWWNFSRYGILYVLNIIQLNSQVIRSRRKQLPPDITTFDEIPNESKKKNTIKQKRDKIFMIFKKNHNLIVFQFPFHTELFSKNKHTFFMDGTFYIAPIFSY